VATEFEDFRALKDLDPVDYLVNVLKEQHAYMNFRPLLAASAQTLNAGGSTIESMWKMRTDLDHILKGYSSKMGHRDWVLHAMDRYEKYMEKHGKEGLAGLTTGIKALDELTGGWKADDLILLVGRLSEGKSLIATYFAYKVWLSLQATEVTAPVIYISTEMPSLEIEYRLDTMRAHFSNRGLNDGKLPDHMLYREYAEELSKKRSTIKILTQDDNKGNPFTPADVRAIIELEKPAFIVIDQLYDLSDGTGERDIRKKVVNVSTAIREVNLATMTPIMLLAQAGREAAKESRKSDKASPEIDQIQESDNPAQKATRVITLRKLDTTIKLSLKKNRGGERNKDVYLRSDIDRGFWEEIDEAELVF
jgi:replicative DNA helicase